MRANRVSTAAGGRARFAAACCLLVVLVAAAATARGDRIELYTGRVVKGKLIEQTRKFIRFRTIHAGGIVMEEVFSVDEVKRLVLDQPATQPATQPTTRPASQPATRPASRPGPRIPAPWPGGPDVGKLPPGLDGEDDEDPAVRYERALRLALQMRKDARKRGPMVRLLSIVVNSADREQLARLSDLCKDETTLSLADFLARGRIKWAEKRGYGRKFRLSGVTAYEKDALLNLLGERITANRKIVSPYTRGTMLPAYGEAKAVRTAARLLGDQLREWIRLLGDLSARDRGPIFKELRVLRKVVIKASKALAKAPRPKKNEKR